MQKHRNILVSLVAAVLVAATGARAEDIIIATPNPSYVPLLPITVALGEGYFEDEGLNVRVEALNGSGAVLQSLASGQAQIGNPGAGPFLSARARDLDVTFLYRLNPNSSYGLVVPEASDADTPEKLRGKVIGIGTADGAEAAFTRSIFNDSGMTEGTDYSFLVVGDGGLAIAAFSRGDIDAYAAATGDAAILNSRGIPVRNITPDRFRKFFGNGLAAMTAYIEENPDVVERFGRAIVKGARFAEKPENIDAVVDHIATINPQEAEDRDFVKALVEQIIVRQAPFEPAKGFGYQDHEAWVAWQDSLAQSGDLEKPVADLNAVYTNEFVERWNAVD